MNLTHNSIRGDSWNSAIDYLARKAIEAIVTLYTIYETFRDYF